MATLLIPTRNRPTSLAGVLGFLGQFYPEAKVIVADGSAERGVQSNARAIDALSEGRQVTHRPYPEDVSYFERLIAELKVMDDEFVVIGSDDDYPMMDVFEEGEVFLRENSDYSLYLGPLVNLELGSPSVYRARLNQARNVEGADPLQRMRFFSQWPFPTTYAVGRREYLIRRFELVQNLIQASFHDFTVGCCDAFEGKIRATADIGFICTRNYGHSYYRATDRLMFLKESEQVLKIRSAFAELVASATDNDRQQSLDIATQIVMRRIYDMSGGWAPQRRDFLDGAIFRQPEIQRQVQMFEDLFKDGSASRGRYLERMQYVSKTVRACATSTDNENDPHFHSTFESFLTTINEGHHTGRR